MIRGRSTLRRTILTLVITLTASVAGSETISMAHCPLDPGFEAWQKRCENGEETPATCAVVRVFERLARGDRETAVEILEREIGYPVAARSSVLPWMELLAKAGLTPDGPPECVQAQAGILFEVGENLLSDSDPWMTIFMGRIFEWPAGLIEKVEERLLARDDLETTREFARIYREIWLSTENGRTMSAGARSNPMLEMICGQTPEPLTGGETIGSGDGEPDPSRLDMALSRLRAEGLEVTRKAVLEALSLAEDEKQKAIWTARAGVGFLMAERYEAALEFLTMADSIFSKVAAGDSEALRLQVLTRYMLATAHRSLGQSAQEEHVVKSAESLLKGKLGEDLKDVGSAFMQQDPAAMRRLRERLSSGELGIAEAEGLEKTMSAIIPGLGFDFPIQLGASSAPAPAQGSCGHKVLKILEHLSLKRFEEATAATEELILRYPNDSSVYLLAVIAGGQWLAEDHQGALHNMRKAIDALETKVEDFRVAEVQTAYVGHRAYLIFRLAVELAAQSGRVEEAFDYAERGRSWTLRRILGGAQPGAAAQAGVPSTEEKALLSTIHALEQKREEASPEELQFLTQNLERQRLAFMATRTARKLAAADENPLANVDPITLDRLQNTILDDETTLLVYAEGTGNLWTWVIDREAVEMVFLPWSGDKNWATEVLETAAGIRGARPLATPSDAALKDLYKRLIEPVAEHLRHESLIIVPHGVLHHFPFAALRHPTTGRYLVEDSTLSLAPSATSLATILGRGDADVTSGEISDEILVVGDPETRLTPLAGARREARAVASFLGAEPLLGRQATRSAVLGRVETVGLLHLATHGEYLPTAPIFSRLWLSSEENDEGLAVEMHEIWDQWRMPKAALVTLSGCETALSELTRGDEVIGLTQAFLAAGSRAVLSTLWSVGDEPSEELVVSLYRHLLGGETVASALSAAQRELIQQGHRPFVWAGYTLTGDPRVRWQAVGSPRRKEGTLPSSSSGKRPAPVAPPQDAPSMEDSGQEEISENRGWPTLLSILLAVGLAGLVALGFLLPPRFPPRLGVVLSREEDMEGGDFHRLPPLTPFLRPATVYVSSGRLTRRPKGALARLRASRRGARIQAVGGRTLWYENVAGDWEPLPVREQKVRYGTVYRDEAGKTFFQVRRGA